MSRTLLLLALAALAGGAHAQTLYKCVQPDGRVVYQQEKCDDRHKQSTVRQPDPVAPKTVEELTGAAAKASKQAELEKDQLVAIMADTHLCMSGVPDFEARHTPAIRRWNARHREQALKFANDDEARARSLARAEADRARLAADKNRNALAEHCDRFAARLDAPQPGAAPKK